MNLMAEVKLKNNQLLLRDAALEQQLRERVSTPEFSSFLITFIAVPFIVGAAAHCALGSNKVFSHKFYRVALSGWRLWSLW
jgi:hypothetical protein